ncbi:amidase [soil metagenome]
MRDYIEHDATSLAELVATKQVSAKELLDAALARAAAVNPKLNAIVIPMTEIARARAAEALTGPFAGVPFLIKDIQQDYAGVPSTSGSRALRDYRPSMHSEAVKRFLSAGFVIFGKTATPEFALKAITETELFGATRNPWDPERTPGGSSGGAASAVASGIVPVAGASDGGGSIRIPASYCGLFGLLPSRGRVPSAPRGEIWEGALGEHVLTRSVRDSARILDAIHGPDRGAPFQIAKPERPFAEEVGRDPGKLRIGFSIKNPVGGDVHPDCIRAVREAVALLEVLGHHVDEEEPNIDGGDLARSYVTMYFGQVAASVAEAKAKTGATDADFELDTLAIALLGHSISAADYVVARKKWNGFTRALATDHARYDLYLTPTTAQPPARIGELTMPAREQTLVRSVLALGLGKALLRTGIVAKLAQKSLNRTPFTQLSNLTGTPSMSVPMLFTDLPFGVQLVARFGEEALLLRLASQIEAARPWFTKRPPEP